MNDLLNAALAYASRGWHVLATAPGSKDPRKGTHGVWDATTDPDILRGWWAAQPDANIGLHPEPSGLVAVDLDCKDGRNGLASWAALKVDNNTVTSQTPSGGVHLIYEANGLAVRNTEDFLGSGIETRVRGYYILLPPSRLSEGGRYEWLEPPDSRDLLPFPAELAARLAPRQPSRAAPALARPANAYAAAALRGEVEAVASTTPGGRNRRLNVAAYNLGQLVAAGLLERGEVERDLEAAGLACGLEEGEVRATVKSGLAAGEANPRVIPEPTARPAPAPTARVATTPTEGERLGPMIDNYNLTDLGNAERLVAKHGADLRWCDRWQAWLSWDGQRWAQDEIRAVDTLAADTIRQIYRAAGETPDTDRREALGKWAARSESESKRRAMLSWARGFLPVRPEDLDRDPWLLNVNNGTLDLLTGELRGHRREDLITKRIPIDYDPNARAPLFLAFLERIFAGNTRLIAFVQKAAGYSLTGSVREQVFFIHYGTGNNGKTTLFEAIGALLADYSQETPADALMLRRRGAASEELARMKGARLVTAKETEEGARLAESLVKSMTGGDTVTARYFYGHFFEYRPEFKLWLASNHKPQIRGTDVAIWRRIRLIPYTVTIPEGERDPDLGQRLEEERAGILAWAVRGCLDWQRDGLGAPEEVRAATAAYQVEMDILGGWVEECCTTGPSAMERASLLFANYREWCDANQERSVSSRDFGARLTERGFDKMRRADGTYYIGLALPGPAGPGGPVGPEKSEPRGG
jgi:P4 family phage/plasmid primase-like protien